MYLKKSTSPYLQQVQILLLPVLRIFIYISLFIPGLIFQRNYKEIRLGIVKQDGLNHFGGFIISKSAILFYALLVLCKMNKETMDDFRSHEK